MIAKNKDDTVIIASSSPTIVQKESAESSGGSTVVSSSTSSVGSIVTGSQLPVVTNNLVGVGTQNAVLAEADAELVIVDQALYESVRQLPLPAAGQLNVIAVAAAAANDPLQQQQHHHHHQQQQQHHQQHVSGSSSFQTSNQQLPTVSTQSTLIEAGLVLGPPSQPAAGHAPLNATNTMKQAPSAVNAALSAPAGQSRKSGSSNASGK